MPTLEYVGNAGRYRLTNSDIDVAQGESVDVDEETAEYLQENAEFVAADDDAGDVIEEALDAGECPWCDDYEGDAVGQHAASAHPDAWNDYTED